MNTERTISIRKVVRIAEGLVAPAQGKAYDAPRFATDITCTIRVDVPVLTEYHIDGLNDWLRRHGFGLDDEIGLLAGALLTGCRFRLPDDVNTVYRWSRSVDGMTAGFSEMNYVRLKDDAAVVVRVRDIFPDYEPLENK